MSSDNLPSGADPDDVTFYSCNTSQGGWVAHDSTLERTTGSGYVFSVDTPGFSKLAVNVPDGTGGSNEESTDSRTDDGTDSGGTETAPPTPTPVATPTTVPTTTAADTGPASGGADGEPPSGDVAGDDRWVHPDNLPTLEVVSVRLETEPADSVYATIIVTLRNPAGVAQDAEVRFIQNGIGIEETGVTAPDTDQINVTLTELITEPRSHTFEANVGLETDNDTFVRIFNFDIGVVELEEAGPDCELFECDFGAFIICWYWWVLLLILLLPTAYLVRNRMQMSQDETE